MVYFAIVSDADDNTVLLKLVSYLFLVRNYPVQIIWYKAQVIPLTKKGLSK